MREPPLAPQWLDLFQALDNDEKLAWLTLSQRDDVSDLVRQANDSYRHWHKFRYLAMPEGVSREHAWAAVQMSRQQQRRSLPIAFDDLNRSLVYWNPPQHLAWLHRIDHEAGGLIGAPRNAILDDEDRYLFSSLMEEAIASSQIEGAQTTRSVAREMLRTRRKPRNVSEQMIVNNYSAILEIREMLRDNLTPQMLCHLHEILTHNTLDDPSRAGRFRTDQDNVRVEDVMTYEVLHRPPHAATLEYRIEQICEFANERAKPFMHPVIKAIVLHFAIGFVHPFIDGNGRTARAIFYWYMLKHGYWLFEYLSVSRIVVAAPAKYGRAYLYTETDAGDVTYFIHYHLNVIIRAIKELHTYLLKQQRKVKAATKLIDLYPGLNHRQARLLNDVLKNPDASYTIRQHEGIHRVSYATARSDLLDLEERGFLTKTQDGRVLRFFPVSDLTRRLQQQR